MDQDDDDDTGLEKFHDGPVSSPHKQDDTAFTQGDDEDALPMPAMPKPIIDSVGPAKHDNMSELTGSSKPERISCETDAESMPPPPKPVTKDKGDAEKAGMNGKQNISSEGKDNMASEPSTSEYYLVIDWRIGNLESWMEANFNYQSVKERYMSHPNNIMMLNIPKDIAWHKSGYNNFLVRRNEQTPLKLYMVGVIDDPCLEECDDNGAWLLDLKIKNGVVNQLLKIFKYGKAGKEKYKSPLVKKTDDDTHLLYRIIRGKLELKNANFKGITAKSPFPLLYDGAQMGIGQQEQRMVEDFVKGTHVAVEFTVHTYDFTPPGKENMFGYTIRLASVDYVEEQHSDEDLSEDEELQVDKLHQSAVLATPRKRKDQLELSTDPVPLTKFVDLNMGSPTKKRKL